MIFYGFILGSPALQQHLLSFSSAAKIFKGILWDLQNLDEEYVDGGEGDMLVKSLISSKVLHILQIEDIQRRASQIPPLLSLVRLRPNGAEIPAQILPPPPPMAILRGMQRMSEIQDISAISVSQLPPTLSSSLR